MPASSDGLTKFCTRCRQTQAIAEFQQRPGRPKGQLKSWCNGCLRELARNVQRRKLADPHTREQLLRQLRTRDLLVNHGMTEADYEAMLQRQNGKCAICGRPETMTARGKVRRIAIDHDHKTGRVRALLCGACNAGLGNFQDDPALLEKAAAYLRAHCQFKIT